MIFLDFKIDETVLAEDLEADIPKIGERLFLLSMFIMPVRFQINKIDLFGNEKCPWSDAPIMSIASSGVKSVKKLIIQKKDTFYILEGPGDLKFDLIDEINVKVDFFDGNHILAQANYDELLDAFQQFADKVRKFLWERAPQMNDHPYWGPWLRGEKD